jgi:hypothetical protein
MKRKKMNWKKDKKMKSLGYGEGICDRKGPSNGQVSCQRHRKTS